VEVELEVVEALAGLSKRVREERLLAPSDQQHLLFAREALLADLGRQRQKEFGLLLGCFVLDSYALGFPYTAAQGRANVL